MTSKVQERDFSTQSASAKAQTTIRSDHPASRTARGISL